MSKQHEDAKRAIINLMDAAVHGLSTEKDVHREGHYISILNDYTEALRRLNDAREMQEGILDAGDET